MTAAHRQGNVREFQSVWRVVTLEPIIILFSSEDVRATVELGHSDPVLAAQLCDWLKVDDVGLLATNRTTFLASGAELTFETVGCKTALCVCESNTVGWVPACVNSDVQSAAGRSVINVG